MQDFRLRRVPACLKYSVLPGTQGIDNQNILGILECQEYERLKVLLYIPQGTSGTLARSTRYGTRSAEYNHTVLGISIVGSDLYSRMPRVPTLDILDGVPGVLSKQHEFRGYRGYRVPYTVKFFRASRESTVENTQYSGLSRISTAENTQ